MKAGLYIRLSINDSLNDSINNQTNILKEYCYINNISIYDIYIDNGYTGTNYNRPEFNRLIRDIEKNYVDTVITKDFSRLGRDYIETGKYIEKYFPENNIRYISILDNYDSNSNIDDYIPFKFIINEMSDSNEVIIRSIGYIALCFSLFLFLTLKIMKYMLSRKKFNWKITNSTTTTPNSITPMLKRSFTP